VKGVAKGRREGEDSRESLWHFLMVEQKDLDRERREEAQIRAEMNRKVKTNIQRKREERTGIRIMRQN
jgi:hypothetical protein